MYILKLMLDFINLGGFNILTSINRPILVLLMMQSNMVFQYLWPGRVVLEMPSVMIYTSELRLLALRG